MTGVDASLVIIDDFVPTWERPYTYEPHFPFGFVIKFDGDILVWVPTTQMAERICGWLNGAYNLGRSSYVMERIERSRNE